MKQRFQSSVSKMVLFPSGAGLLTHGVLNVQRMSNDIECR